MVQVVQLVRLAPKEILVIKVRLGHWALGVNLVLVVLKEFQAQMVRLAP